MKIKYLQVLEMPNGEVLCEGKTIGYTRNLGKYLLDMEVTHIGEDYAKIEVNGEEYETAKGIGEAIQKVGKEKA